MNTPSSQDTTPTLSALNQLIEHVQSYSGTSEKYLLVAGQDTHPVPANDDHRVSNAPVADFTYEPGSVVLGNILYEDDGHVRLHEKLQLIILTPETPLIENDTGKNSIEDATIRVLCKEGIVDGGYEIGSQYTLSVKVEFWGKLKSEPIPRADYFTFTIQDESHCIQASILPQGVGTFSNLRGNLLERHTCRPTGWFTKDISPLTPEDKKEFSLIVCPRRSTIGAVPGGTKQTEEELTSESD